MKRRIIGLGCVLALVGAGIAYAATRFSDSQANSPQVVNAPRSDDTAHFPTNKQNEPSIAVNPVDSSKLIAGSNDEQAQPECGPGAQRGSTAPGSDCSFFPDVGTDGVYTSADGGKTWTNRGLLPGFAEDGGSLVSDGDPVIVYGPAPNAQNKFSFTNGVRAYYSGLASYAAGQAKGNQAPELLTVSSSDDDGVTWRGPVVAADGHGIKFNDKEAIWADRNPASPFFGRVYVSWTQFRDVKGCAEPVMFVYSADGGRTWSRPNQLSVAQNCAKGGRQGSTLRTGADGAVYVLWEDSDNAGPKQVVAVSKDGGVSFSKAADVARVTDIADPIPGSNFRTDSFPSLGVDQRTGALYAAWSTAAGGSAQIVVYKSVDAAATWQKVTSLGAGGYAFFQGLDVAPNGRVDVGWQEQRATSTATYGTGNATIDSFYSSSGDRGATWTAPVKATSASSDPAASAQNNLARQFWGDYNTLVSTDAQAWFIYTDSRHGVGCPAVDRFQQGSAPKPAPKTDCPSQFGNTDVYVSKITP
jgi:hypothetical protein